MAQAHVVADLVQRDGEEDVLAQLLPHRLGIEFGIVGSLRDLQRALRHALVGKVGEVDAERAHLVHAIVDRLAHRLRAQRRDARLLGLRQRRPVGRRRRAAHGHDVGRDHHRLELRRP